MIAAFLLMALASAAHANQKLLYEPTFVSIELPAGGQAKLEAFVVRPNRPGKFPLVVVVHGTPRGSGGEFRARIAQMSPDFHIGIAEAFAERGYAAVSIMRRGFGHSSGPYAEHDSGGCNHRDYERVGRISAQDVLGATAALRNEPWVDPERILLLGHSTGGMAVIAAGAANPLGVVGILSFAGGSGSVGPDQVCSEDRLIGAFKAFGATARIPALWVYAENDHHFGPDLARRMFDAYRSGGAPAQLVMLPPVGRDGHMALPTAPLGVIWPPMAAFLASLHLPTERHVE